MKHVEQQIAFIRELDRLKSVYRQSLVKSDNNRFENSAEHSWHICMIAHVLREYVDEPVDVDRVVRMLLIHDIVEIDAGDTFAFSQAPDLAQQRGKELKAVERIFGLLPSEQREELIELWLDFEDGHSIESRYAKSIDRVVPVFMNMANEGGGWRRHTLTRSQLLKRNEFLRTTMPRLWGYITSQIDLAVSNGWLQGD
jgi:putative hydrolases of HD superfamily